MAHISELPQPELQNSSPPSQSADSAQTAYDPEGFFTPEVIRHNMKMVILLEAILMTGTADLSNAMVPLMNFLTPSYFVMGIIQALAFAGIIGAICAPFVTRRFPYKKWYYITVTGLWALAPMVLGLGLVFSPHINATLHQLLILTVVCQIGFNLMSGFSSLAHNEFLASCIPPSHRGRMFGISTTMYSVLAIGVTQVGYFMLDRIAKPASYGYIFIMTCTIWYIGFFFAAFAWEKRTPVENSPPPWRLSMLKAAWHDKPFIRFMIFWCLASLTFLPVYGFLGNFGLKELHMADKTTAILKNISLTVTIATSWLAGWLIDKYTPKKVIPACMLIASAGFLLFYFYWKPLGLYIASGIISGALVGFYPCGTILSVSIPKPQNRAGHFAIQSVTTLACMGIGMLTTGLFTDLAKPKNIVLYAAIVAFLFFFFSKYMFRVLGDTWKSYS